jgi:integrase
MARIRKAPDYIHEYVDRHGKPRRYFRKHGKNLGKLPLGSVLSAEFTAAYQAYLGQQPAPAPIVTRPLHDDSLAKLIADFYSHPWFTKTAPSTRRAYRSVLDPIVREHGHRSVAAMTAEHAEYIIGKIGEQHPAMANLTRAAMRRAMKLAISKKLRPDNPFLEMEPYKGGSHHTWTDGELRLYEKRWRLGSRERLAYALLLYTGQRVGDVVKMNRADISDGSIHVIQQKTGAEVWIPIHPELARAMKAYPAKGLTLIGAASGRPLTRFALSKLMQKAIKEAGLPPRCVPHGLRKAHLRLVADGGGTTKELQSTGGHKTLRELERYTEAADKKRLARSAISKMQVPKTG